MEGLLIVLGGSGMLAFFFAIWLNTQKGKKWLSNLQCTFHWTYDGIMDALTTFFNNQRYRLRIGCLVTYQVQQEMACKLIIGVYGASIIRKIRYLLIILRKNFDLHFESKYNLETYLNYYLIVSLIFRLKIKYLFLKKNKWFLMNF